MASQSSAVLKKQHSSLVIDTLNGADGDGVAVPYVYCDFTTRNMQSTSAVLGSVLRQIVRALEEIPDEVQQAFELAKKQDDGCGLQLLGILDMLTKFLLSLDRGSICIGALDKSPTKHRAQLWSSLHRITQECSNMAIPYRKVSDPSKVWGYFHEEADIVRIEPTSGGKKVYSRGNKTEPRVRWTKSCEQI